jgi:hypothetical protein
VVVRRSSQAASQPPALIMTLPLHLSFRSLKSHLLCHCSESLAQPPEAIKAAVLPGINAWDQMPGSGSPGIQSTTWITCITWIAWKTRNTWNGLAIDWQ